MQERKIRLTSQEKSFMEDLYAGGHCYIKLMDGKNRTGIFPHQASMKGPHLEDILNSKYLSHKNLMCSISSYYEKGHATVDNIHAVNCIPIDVDFQFTDKKGNLLPALEVWKMLQKDIIDKCCFFPQPTYLEYGHRFRLIYMLESPFILPKENKIRRRDMIIFIRRIMEELCKMINNMNLLYHAEVQKLTSFIRVPESVNNKYETYYLQGEKAPHFHLTESYIINTIPVGRCQKWNIFELADFVLPELPEWYNSYKKRLKNKKEQKSNPGIHISKNTCPYHEMMKKRLDFLCMLQNNGYDIGHREFMCFLYWNFALQSGITENEAKEAVLDFNSHFEHPMPEKEMLTKSRPRKLYIYRMSTVMNDLAVPEWLAVSSGCLGMDKNTYQRLYMKQYRKYKKIIKYKAEKTKKQLMQKASDIAKILRQAGKKIVEIAEELKVSISTVKRYLVMA